MVLFRQVISFLLLCILTLVPFKSATSEPWVQTAQVSPELERDGTPKKYFTISFDDGITQDLKIIEILKKYGFYDCTFNINTGLCGEEWSWVGENLGRPDVTHKRFTKSELMSGIYDGFDVEAHSLNHKSLKDFDDSAVKLRNEINADAVNIYKFTGVYPLGMAWPGGDTEYTDKTIEIVMQGTRTRFARAATSTGNFALPEYFMKWYPTCSISDGSLLTLAEEFLSADCNEDMLFNVWGHGYELDLNDGYDELEKLIKMMSEAQDVVTVTNAEFYLLFKDEIPAYKTQAESDVRQKYSGSYSQTNGAFAGTDELNREIPTDSLEYTPNDNTVGIFYFLWHGEHGTGGPYDNSKIVANNPSAILSHENWIAAGGGAISEFHFWGEPMFGYYKISDKWVLLKHAQMLTDAGIDYVIFDATNAYPYSERVVDLIDVWYPLMLQGVKVPQLAFYTNTDSADTITRIYNELYNNNALREKYPQLDKMWFRWNKKPMIIGETEGLSREIKSYYTIKRPQWPIEKKKNNSWPWMEFSRSLTRKAVYRDRLLRKTVINVSIAQHSDTVSFSNTAWYGGNDRTRSWHNGANDTGENAMNYGYNFAEQWEFALKRGTPTVFVTGWNEWTAQRGDDGNTQKPILFCDCADYNNSRDAEPMNGRFGDNYYMQLADYVNRYKGAKNRVDVGEYTSIDIKGSFDQWNSEKITAVYTDYQGDTAHRNWDGFGTLHYTNTTGRNDFTLMKTTHDENNVYFYAETAADIVGESGDNKMVLFLNTNEDNPNWYGYDFAVNLQGDRVISRCNGGWDWESIDDAEVNIQGNKMMLKIPYSVLGLDKHNDSLINLRFKWADNFQKNDNGEYDIFTFYKDGDVAPIGRFDYIYSDVK